MLKPIGTSVQVVPMLNLEIEQYRSESASKNIEFTETELQGYYVTPETAMSGFHSRKLTFAEAISLFIV